MQPQQQQANLGWKDHNIIITGAAKGIGFCIAQRLAREGANLILCDRDNQTLQNSTNQIRQQFNNQNVHSVACDVSKQQDVERLFSECQRLIGSCSILVNNASVADAIPFEQIKSDQLNNLFQNNVTSMLMTEQQALKHFRQRHNEGKMGHGSMSHCWILNMSSFSTMPRAQLEGKGGWMAAYDVCAAGINALTYTTAQYCCTDLKRELPNSHIRVVGIAPYIFDTDMSRHVKESLGSQAENVDIGDPNMVANAICDAISGRIDMKTGNVFTVNTKGESKPIQSERFWAHQQERQQQRTASA